MPRYSFRGGAAKCTATGAVGAADVSVPLTGDTSGWPDGAFSRPFLAELDRGVPGKTEKIVCTTLSGGALVVSQRGADGTTATTHDAGCTVEHCLGAVVIDDLSDHAYNVARDDHEQYVPSDTTIRGFSNVAGIVDAPVDIGATLLEGTSEKLARADHVHAIPPGFIIAADIADNNLTTAKFGDLQVTGPKIAPGAIDATKLAANLGPIIICTSSTRPAAPFEGLHIWESDTDREYVYVNGSWTWLFSASHEEAPTPIYYAPPGNQDTPGAINTWPTGLTGTFAVPPWAVGATVRGRVSSVFAVTSTSTIEIALFVNAVEIAQNIYRWDPAVVNKPNSRDIMLSGVNDVHGYAGSNQVVKMVATVISGTGAIRCDTDSSAFLEVIFRAN